MQKDNELFTTMPVGKAVIKLAVPTVISQIVVILYSLADTFFVGQIGDPNQLAAFIYYISDFYTSHCSCQSFRYWCE